MSDYDIDPNASMEVLAERWKTIFDDRLREEIMEADTQNEESVILDWYVVDMFDPALAEFMIEHPYAALSAGDKALSYMSFPSDNPPKHVRIVNIPDTQKHMISNLRSEHIFQFVTVEGIVSKTTAVLPRITDAKWECLKCGAIITVKQKKGRLDSPTECSQSQGGCGRKSSFKLRHRGCERVDSQKIEIQEPMEQVKGSTRAETLTLIAEDDLAGEVNPGDRIVANGVLVPDLVWKNRQPQSTTERKLDVMSIEKKENAFEEIQVDREDKEDIRELGKREDIYETWIQSIAPSLHGMAIEKEAALLQLFSGVTKHVPGGNRIRGDIHVLLVGDPGTGKSQLLERINSIAPRSVKTSGEGATAAGLTAAAIRDSGWGENSWVLEAGAMVLADLGILCIDELDKMEGKDRNSLHRAMEQQEININKAGINTTLKSRCAMLAAANPKEGRFDQFSPVPEQVSLPYTLLSRFDVILLVEDQPGGELDEERADFILELHRAGSINTRNPGSPDVARRYDLEPQLSIETMRKYISYARSEIKPQLTDEAQAKLHDYYTTLREASDRSVAITPRQLEGLIRLSEASARIRLSEGIEKRDAERAIKIMKRYLTTVARDFETGDMDIDTIETGRSRSQRDRIRLFREIFKQIEDEDGYVTEDKLVSRGMERGISEKKLMVLLRRKKRSGEIMEPRHGRLKWSGK